MVCNLKGENVTVQSSTVALVTSNKFKGPTVLLSHQPLAFSTGGSKMYLEVQITGMLLHSLLLVIFNLLT